MLSQYFKVKPCVVYTGGGFKIMNEIWMDVKRMGLLVSSDLGVETVGKFM